MINIHYVHTQDDLRLQGVEYQPEKRDVCVLMVHGMSGNFIENYFCHVTGETLSESGFGFIYAHNRGYNHINDIDTSKLKESGGYKTIRVGAVYETFEDCLKDIKPWIEKCKRLGYRRLVLAGHSLGAPKIVYYLSKEKVLNLVGVILASPADMVGLIKTQPGYETLFDEARLNMKNGESRKLLSTLVWGSQPISSKTFLSLFEEKNPVNNLPVHNKDAEFKELSLIDVPILCTMGEFDDIAIDTLEKDMDLIGSKAISCPSFTKKFIPKGSHTYDSVEKDFANVILEWVRSLK